MTLSMYDASAPVFIRGLNQLAAILHKAAAHAQAHKIDPSVLVNARLYPDMFPLARQIQIATDHARGAPARLAGITRPSYPDTEATFDELQARIAKTIAFIETFKPEQIDGSEERTIIVPVRGNNIEFKGAPYLLGFAQPNFYFHTTTAYAILRHCGVEIGKMDFLGSLPV
ncbi:DUF1993 domain-containing protein [Dokdonella soli]|uniref:DUF1993 family protein n=1 Tax=Dokdonella soli TaxID=529810 RepID=A0ABN1IG50_9GAMM